MFEKIKNPFIYNKDKYDNMLDDPKSKAGRFFDLIILGIVLIFPIILIVESIGNNAYLYVDLFFYIDALISTVFLIEYIYRYIKHKNKIDFLYSPIRIIDLLSFLPFFLGFFAAGDLLKLFRILRVLRVLRLIKRIPLTTGFIKSLKDYSDEYRAVFTLYLIILFLGSFFVYYIESNIPGSKFYSIPDALWWGIVTMTTVGYGDIYPISGLGKLVGSILVFLGPLMGALTGAITIMVFMETSKNELQNKRIRGKFCSRCKTKNIKEANYCIKCGEQY